MKLNIPPLSQRDERWKLKKLGTSSVTIGNYGCLLTCHSMMLSYYGHELLPDVLNEVYKSKGVYDNENLINFWAAANCFDDITVEEYYECPDIPCDLSKIDKHLAEQKPVIAKVDFSPTAGIQTHFILIVGKDDAGSYIVNDPWYGDEQYFQNRYGEPSRYIYGLRLYSGTPKEENVEDKISDLQDKLKSANEALAEKSLEVNNLRDDLETQERDNKDLASQLLEARTQRNQAVGEKKELERKVTDLEKQADNLKSDIKVLQGEKTSLSEALVAQASLSISNISTLELIKTVIKRLLTHKIM